MGSNVLAFIIKKQTVEQFATNTDPNLIQRIATETSRDKQTHAIVYPIAAKGGKLSDANKVLPKEPSSKVLRKHALGEAWSNDVGEAYRKMGYSSNPSEVSSSATPRTLLESIGLDNVSKSTGHNSKAMVNKIKLINRHLGLHNHVDTFEQLRRTTVPVLKAINLSRISTEEYTRLWLARMGQPSLDMLCRMQRRVKKAFAQNKLKSNLAEDNWIHTKANFRAKSHSSQDSQFRCKPDEAPWDVILFDGHGPMDVQSINGCVYAYYFRSRKGGAAIVKGVRKKSEFPYVLEEVILEVRNKRNFNPKVLMCDNAGEFISDLAMAMYDTYDLTLDPIAPHAPQAGGLWEKLIGDIKRRSATNMLQAPWMPASMWLLSDQYAAEVQMYYSEYAGNPNCETPFEIENPASGEFDLNRVGIRTFGCPTQFKDVGLERDSYDDEGKLKNPKRDEVTINGFFAGKEGMATRIYQKSLHRLIKIPIQNAEFHEAEFTQPCPKQSDLETAMNLEVPPSVLPSLTKLRNITEGEEKWDCSAQTTETQPYLSALPNGIPNNKKRSEQSSTEGNDQANSESDEVNRPNKKVRLNECIDETNEDEMETPGPRKSRRKKRDREENSSSESSLYKTVKDNETLDSIAEKFQVAWQDLKLINEFENHKGEMKPLCRLQKIKLGTEINLPCLKIKIAKVMEIIKNITEEEISGRLNKSEDPNDPYNVGEKEARTWTIPEDFWDVLKDPLWKEWIEAIRKEMKGFEDNEVFLTTPRSEAKATGKKIIPNKELYSRKYKNGKLTRHKYRHTARGDFLRAGVDYGNSYWSSASSTTLKIFCAIAAESGHQPETIDVSTAYLEAQEENILFMERASFGDYINKTDHELETLREEIMEMSQYELQSFKKTERARIKAGDVEQCLKAVYGVATSGRFWGKTLRKALEDMGLKRSKIDHSLYTIRTSEKFDPEGKWLIVCTITDDIPFVGDPESKQWFIDKMKARFNITHDPEFTGIIGVQTKWDNERKTLELTQTALIEKIAERFKEHIPDSRKTKFTPLPEKLDKTDPNEISDEDWEEAKHFDFPGFVCSLGYVAEWSKPELLFTRSYLSTYLRRWDMTRVNYAKQALMYMIHHKMYGTIYSKNTDAHGPFVISAFADGSLMNESKSRSRVARLVKMAGASVAAKTNKTTTVHLSSASVETEAACHAALDIVGIRHLLEEIGIWYNKPVVIYEDNQPTIQVANNERSLADAGRHLETRNYKLSELVENESVILTYMSTERQVADLLTKSLAKIAFERLRDDLTGYSCYNLPGNNIHEPSLRAIMSILATTINPQD